MGKRREKIKPSWSHLDWIQERKGRVGAGVRHRKNSAAVGPRFKKLQSEALEQKLFSEFSCIEELQELPNGFTKIRSKNLDIIFKRDFYKKKMIMTSSGFFYDGDSSSCQPSAVFDQLDLDEIPEFRPREGSFNTSLGNDSGYSSSFQESQPPPPPQYLPQPVPQFYLYSPSANTLIPCEEIIISKTILGPRGPLYHNPTKAYVAYPVQGPDGRGYITQPFTGPDISSSPQQEHEGRREEVEKKTVRTKTPGIKQLPVMTKYIPGLPPESLKTKKRRKKKSKPKPTVVKSELALSSSESDSRPEIVQEVDAPQTEDVDLEIEASEAINEIEIQLTDDLTNSLVNPPTEDDDIENAELIENFIESCEVPTKVKISYSEAVCKPSKPVLMISKVEEPPIPTEVIENHEKPSNQPNLKSKNKTRKKKLKNIKVPTENAIQQTVGQIQEEENKEVELSDTSSDLVSGAINREEEEQPAVIELAVRPRRKKKRKGMEKGEDKEGAVRVMVMDHQASAEPCQTPDCTEVFSRHELLVVKELGHGMTRGMMDLERPFKGYFSPPETLREPETGKELLPLD